MFFLKYEALTKKKLSLVRHFCEEQRISENKVPSPNQDEKWKQKLRIWRDVFAASEHD